MFSGFFLSGERKKKAKSEGQWKSVKDECFSGSYLREYIKRDNKLKPRSLLLKGEHLVSLAVVKRL